jgi:hypothetical protein
LVLNLETEVPAPAVDQVSKAQVDLKLGEEKGNLKNKEK